MDFVIEPVSFQRIASRIKIDVSVILDAKATIRIAFYEDGSEFMPLEVQMLVLEGEDYKKWGNDDKYIVDYVFEKLGINITPPQQENTI